MRSKHHDSTTKRSNPSSPAPPRPPVPREHRGTLPTGRSTTPPRTLNKMTPMRRARPRAALESRGEICVRLLKTARCCVLAALERQDPAKTTRTVFAVSVAETPSHETLGASRTDLRVMDNRIRPREPTLHDALACSPESLRSLCRLYAHRRAHRRATIFRTEGLPKTSYPGAIIPDCG